MRKHRISEKQLGAAWPEKSTMNESISDNLDRYFSSLDDAPTGSSAIFTNERAKQRYETLLSFALNKLHSAEYHRRNIVSFIENEDTEREEAASQLKERAEELEASPLQNTEFKYTSRFSADEYGYELAAFLVDLKTGLDFLATIIAYHLRGVEADSIQTLIKLVEKGKTSPVLEVVSKWLDWLIDLRDYRHHLAHRLVIKSKSGFIVHRVGTHRPRTRLPVVVPERSPNFVFDTRMTRLRDMHLDDDPPIGLVLGEGRGTVTLDDGSEEVIFAELDALPSPGYVAIEDFMHSHLNNFRLFFIELLSTLETFDLEVIDLVPR